MSKFELGQVVMTRGIVESEISEEKLLQCIKRHSEGDWGDLHEEDAELNDDAVENGEDRILSAYTIQNEKIWVTTEHDKSVTTILFPCEY